MLDRPARRNAIDAALAAAIVDGISRVKDAGAIVLTGEDPAFCAGLDLREVGVDRLIELPPFLDAVATSPVPVIAAVNGPAATGGLELALACDFIVASTEARFADTHLAVGVYPGPVLVDLPRRVGAAWAREMTLTGRFVDADTALRIGLVNHVVAHGDLVPFAVDLAAAIAEKDAGMVADARRDWDQHDCLPVTEARDAHLAFAIERGYDRSTADDLVARGGDLLRRRGRS